jgi:general secretion pathway protein J
MKRPRIPRQRGFTFIEVLVAVGVFAVVSSISYATLSQYLKVREGVSASNLELRQLQRAFSLLDRDLRFLVNRPVRDGFGDPEPAWLANGNSVDGELFRMTVSEPDFSVQGGTRLSRVAWRLVDGDLYRDTWLVLDRVQDSEPVSRLILRGIRDIALQTYAWDQIQGVQQRFDDAAAGVPYAVEFTLSTDDDKTFRRLFDLANGA